MEGVLPTLSYYFVYSNPRFHKSDFTGQLNSGSWLLDSNCCYLNPIAYTDDLIVYHVNMLKKIIHGLKKSKNR